MPFAKRLSYVAGTARREFTSATTHREKGNWKGYSFAVGRTKKESGRHESLTFARKLDLRSRILF
jgi:hypothetical protein